MARPAAKALPPKHLVALAVVAVLGLVLVADYLWASSSSASPSAVWSSRINLPTNPAVQAPPIAKNKKDKKPVGSMDINATFADLPAPELKWEEMAEAPVVRLDGAAIQIKNLLYVFAGYGTINHVHSHVDIYNFSDNTWGGRFDMPKDMAHSHLGMVTDGRFIYVVTGQYGPQCRGPTARNFVLDTVTKEWHDLPPLPVPRYAPATQLWRGRLHVMGGSKEDRHEPGLEHWSLAVKDGKALEKEWRSEIPIPRGGPHRACVVANDKLLVIGGQEGDFMAKPGSPIFKCVRRSEVVFSNVYMLDDEMTWKELPPMPKPDSHIEFAWVNQALAAGLASENQRRGGRREVAWQEERRHTYLRRLLQPSGSGPLPSPSTSPAASAGTTASRGPSMPSYLSGVCLLTLTTNSDHQLFERLTLLQGSVQPVPLLVGVILPVLP